MFWGITLDAGKRYTQTVEQSFHLSMAALGFQNSSSHPVTIMVEVDKAQYALCTLKPGNIPQQPLDYTFTEGEEITFFTEGHGEVHLTGYLIEEIEPVDFEGENGLSESEDESESESVSDDDEDGDSSSSDEKDTLQLLMDATKTGEGSADEDEDDDDWDPSKDNPSPKEKKKEKRKRSLEKKEKNKESHTISSLFMDWGSEDDGDEDDEWNPDTGNEKTTKKTKGKKRKSERLKHAPDKNGEDTKEETTTDTTNSQGERPKKKAKKSKGSKTSLPKDVMHVNVSEDKDTVKQETLNTTPSDSSHTSQSPNKSKHSHKDKEGKQHGSKSPSPTKKLQRTLPGGVIIEDLTKGTGQAAKNGQKVSLLYRGVLAKNKKQFDACLNRKSPFTFVLGKGDVIRGWDLGVAGMQVGGKRKLIIPPSQGYGSEKMGPIPPQSTLEFEVELVSTK